MYTSKVSVTLTMKVQPRRFEPFDVGVFVEVTRDAQDCGADGPSKEDALNEAHRQASAALTRILEQELTERFGPEAVKACLHNGGGS